MASGRGHLSCPLATPTPPVQLAASEAKGCMAEWGQRQQVHQMHATCTAQEDQAAPEPHQEVRSRSTQP